MDELPNFLQNLAPVTDVCAIMIMLEELKKHSTWTEDIIRKYPIVAAPIQHTLVERIIRQVRLSRTNECYFTNGGMDDKDRLVDVKKPWTIREKHRRLLLKLSQKHKGIDAMMIQKLDESLRVKRGRGFTYVLVCNTGEERTGFVYDITYRAEDNNGEEGSVGLTIPIQIKF